MKADDYVVLHGKPIVEYPISPELQKILNECQKEAEKKEKKKNKERD